MQNISGLAARNPRDPIHCRQADGRTERQPAERTEPAKHKSKQTNGSANLLCNPRLYSASFATTVSQPASVSSVGIARGECVPTISLQSFSHLQFVLLLPGRSRQFNYSAVDPKRRTSRLCISLWSKDVDVRWVVRNPKWRIELSNTFSPLLHLSVSLPFLLLLQLLSTRFWQLYLLFRWQRSHK